MGITYIIGVLDARRHMQYFGDKPLFFLNEYSIYIYVIHYICHTLHHGIQIWQHCLIIHIKTGRSALMIVCSTNILVCTAISFIYSISPGQVHDVGVRWCTPLIKPICPWPTKSLQRLLNYIISSKYTRRQRDVLHLARWSNRNWKYYQTYLRSMQSSAPVHPIVNYVNMHNYILECSYIS